MFHEIPNITNLATTTALTTVENKIHSVSNLVKKSDYNATVIEIEKKLLIIIMISILLIQLVGLDRNFWFNIKTSKFIKQKWYY